MQFRSLIPALFLLFAVAVVSGPAAAQPGAEGPPGLFKGAGEASPQAMNAVGQKRMATLKQDSTTQSIRLVRIAGNLSQRRTLIMHVAKKNRTLAPDVPPAFQREHPGQGRAKGPGQSRGRQRTKLFIRRDGINAIDEGTYAWAGTVRAGPGKKVKIGDVTLIHGEEGEITGTIRIEGEYYQVRPLSNDLHALVEQDESKYSKGGDSPLHSGGSTSERSSSFAKSADSQSASGETCTASMDLSRIEARVDHSMGSNKSDKTTASCPQYDIDVLAVYTSNAADGRNIEGIINTAIQESNDAYDNSNAYSTSLALAHSQQVGFSTSQDIADDKNRLLNNTEVQSLRNQHDADVVVLLTDAGYTDRYGRSILGLADEIRAEAEDAYAIVEVGAATGGQFTFPHEVGHLQGGQHHPNDFTCSEGDPRCDPEGHIFSDAYGHRFRDRNWWCGWLCTDDYATIMAYPTGSYSNVKHFSNPNVSYDNQSTGTSNRYNAGALQTTYSTIEDFRVPNDLQARFSVQTTDPLGSERTFTANPCGATGSYSYEWRISYNGSGNYGTVVSSQKSFSETFPEGTHYVKLTVTSGSQSDTAVQAFYISGECDGRDPCLKTVSSTTKGTDDKTSLAKQGADGSDPAQVALHAPTPNPVASTTQITYALPERTEVDLAVYDLMGRKVATLDTGTRSAGTHRPRLDATVLPSGTYIVRLRAGEVQKSRRITVVK